MNTRILDADHIRSRIVELRGLRVVLDLDLAAIYGVTTGALNQAVKRNRDRFPGDFCFLVNREEFRNLKSLSVISSSQVHGGRRVMPYAFTELGALMVAAVLSSAKAIEVSLVVVRAFVELRKLAIDTVAIREKLSDLEKRVGAHDLAIADVIDALRALAYPPSDTGERKIGYHQGNR